MKHVRLLNGLRIGYQEWGNASAEKRILSLHGWLDNSNSFTTLGPYLANRGFHVVAMDHIGHGRSDHIGIGGLYSLLLSVSIVREFTTAMGWNATSFESPAPDDHRFDLVGHSMGGIISMIYSATFPENIRKLVLIEALGPMTEKDVNNTPKNLRKAIEAEYSFKARSSCKVYESIDDAVSARIRTVQKYPGKQYLTEQAARWIVARAVTRAGEANSPETADITENAAGPVQFVHDQRLLLPSLIYHTPEQVVAYLKAVQSPSLLISAEQGWPWEPMQFSDNINALSSRGLLQHMQLPGSHHHHIDPSHSAQVADAVAKFLLQN